MKKMILFFSMLISSMAFSCGDRSIPIELVVKRGSNNILHVSFRAPLVFDKYYLLSAQYDKAKSTIPMYGGSRENEQYSSYELTGEDVFFKDSIVTISYGVRSALCLHQEKYKWDQLLEACTNCKNS